MEEGCPFNTLLIYVWRFSFPSLEGPCGPGVWRKPHSIGEHLSVRATASQRRKAPEELSVQPYRVTSSPPRKCKNGTTSTGQIQPNTFIRCEQRCQLNKNGAAHRVVQANECFDDDRSFAQRRAPRGASQFRNYRSKRSQFICLAQMEAREKSISLQKLLFM